MFGKATEYTRVTIDDRPAIRAIGQGSASWLSRKTAFSVKDYPWLEWGWRVDRLQAAADIRIKERQDFGAAIFLFFGQPSLIDRDVPTLAYVWTNERCPEGSIVDSPRRPGMFKAIVVESGGARLGRWVEERRNLAEDFRRAFGREPPEEVRMIALITDNDQTGDPVEAYYGAILAVRE